MVAMMGGVPTPVTQEIDQKELKKLAGTLGDGGYLSVIFQRGHDNTNLSLFVQAHIDEREYEATILLEEPKNNVWFTVAGDAKLEEAALDKVRTTLTDFKQRGRSGIDYPLYDLS